MLRIVTHYQQNINIYFNLRTSSTLKIKLHSNIDITRSKHAYSFSNNIVKYFVRLNANYAAKFYFVGLAFVKKNETKHSCRSTNVADGGFKPLILSHKHFIELNYTTNFLNLISMWLQNFATIRNSVVATSGLGLWIKHCVFNGATFGQYSCVVLAQWSVIKYSGICRIRRLKGMRK